MNSRMIVAYCSSFSLDPCLFFPWMFNNSVFVRGGIYEVRRFVLLSGPLFRSLLHAPRFASGNRDCAYDWLWIQRNTFWHGPETEREHERDCAALERRQRSTHAIRP